MENQPSPPHPMIHEIETPHHAWVRQVAETETGALTRYAYSLCGHPEQARDAVQDAFYRLLKEPRAKVEDHLKPWLYTVVRSRVIDHGRKNRKMTALDWPTLSTQAAPEPSPAMAAESREQAELIQRLLHTLPPAQAEAIRLKYQSGLDYQQIAHIMKRSVNAVGLLLHEGLGNLREKLRQSNRIHNSSP